MVIVDQEYLRILSGFREFLLGELGVDIWSFHFQCSVDRILVHGSLLILMFY